MAGVSGRDIEDVVKSACGRLDCGEWAVRVYARWRVDAYGWDVWVERNEGPQSIDFVPRNWTFFLPYDFANDSYQLDAFAMNVAIDVGFVRETPLHRAYSQRVSGFVRCDE